MGWNRETERRAGKAMTLGGSIYGIVFLVIWNVIAASMGAWFMLIFGLPMLMFMIFRLSVLLRKAKAEKQPKEPWEQTGASEYTSCRGASLSNRGADFCPYCGEKLQADFVFCPKCGRRR